MGKFNHSLPTQRPSRSSFMSRKNTQSPINYQPTTLYNGSLSSTFTIVVGFDIANKSKYLYSQSKYYFSMLITTTGNIEGSRITKYIGLVNGEAIIGANLVKDFFAGISDIVGGRSGAYEQGLREAKGLAIKEMIEQAERLGGNAIIGVDLDYESLNGSMLMVSANGTAVIYE